jgi:hypothetical protein
MDNIWSMVIFLLAGVLAWKFFTSSKEGFSNTTYTTMAPSKTLAPSCSMTQAATIPSYSSLQSQAETQLTDLLNTQNSQTLSPKDLLPPPSTETSCGASGASLQTDLANYSAAIGVARVGVVSTNIPKRYMSLDLRGGEKIASCSAVSPWNMAVITADDIPETRPLC